MRVLHYGTKQDYLTVTELMDRLPFYAAQIEEYSQKEDYEDFLAALFSHFYQVILVTAENTAGKDGVLAARKYGPDLPVIWFSNNREFALQSYQLDCTYFGIKPVTEEKLERAFWRCSIHMRIA